MSDIGYEAKAAPAYVKAQGSSHPTRGDDIQVSHVPSQAGEIEAALTSLHEYLGNLRARLTPVLRPEQDGTPPADQPGTIGPSRSDLANRLLYLADSVQGAVHVVSDLLARLDV